jgi:hypothetical protein
MYEMEGPRLASRRRPADFSASFAPLDRLPGPEPDRCSGCPDHQRLRNPRAGWLRVFSFADGPGLPPCRQRRVPLRRVAQSAASGQRPGAFPFAGWLGVSSYLWPEVAPCRWLRVTPSPRARGIPLPGWFRASSRQWLEDARCRVARGCPRAGWRRVSSSPVAPGSPRAKARGFPFAGWLRVLPGPRPEVSPLPGGSGFSPGQGPRFPLCRVAPGSPRARGPGISLCRVAPDALRP